VDGSIASADEIVSAGTAVGLVSILGRAEAFVE
jgi:hypothetical protein